MKKKVSNPRIPKLKYKIGQKFWIVSWLPASDAQHCDRCGCSKPVCWRYKPTEQKVVSVVIELTPEGTMVTYNDLPDSEIYKTPKAAKKAAAIKNRKLDDPQP